MSTTEKAGSGSDYDIGFQKMVIEKSGLKLNRVHLLKLNSEYVRQGELDVRELFKEDDKTEAVSEIIEVIEEEARRAETIYKVKRSRWDTVIAMKKAEEIIALRFHSVIRMCPLTGLTTSI